MAGANQVVRQDSAPRNMLGSSENDVSDGGLKKQSGEVLQVFGQNMIVMFMNPKNKKP